MFLKNVIDWAIDWKTPKNCSFYSKIGSKSNNNFIQGPYNNFRVIKAIQNPIGCMDLVIMPYEPTYSTVQWSKLLQNRLQTLPFNIAITKYDQKNPKSAPENTNHYLCKSLYRTIISFNMVPGQNSKNFQLTIFEFVQPKKNMSIHDNIYIWFKYVW